MQNENFIDYYALLGLSFNATKEQIEDGYRQALLKTDINVSEKQNLVELAYVVLTDDVKRKVYDESYARLQMNITEDDEKQPVIAEYIKEDADSLLEATKESYDEFDKFVTAHLTNETASMDTKNHAADKAEELYKRGMWPLLGKLKALVGESSVIYIGACEIHSKAVFSLGEVCMWSERYERAIGMYNTALALSANNHELALRCAKAIETAKVAFEENRVGKIKKTVKKTVVEEDEEVYYLPYFSILGFVFIGFFFTMVCFWCVLILLDNFFWVY